MTVAASSFDMGVTDPHELLAAIDLQTWNELRGVKSSEKGHMSDGPQYMEPCGAQDASPIPLQRKQSSDGVAYLASRTGTTEDFPTPVMTGKVQRLGDFIDTDAVRQTILSLIGLAIAILMDRIKLAPAEFLISMKDNEFSGLHCLEYTHPEFRARVGRGLNIVVAGKGFGCGSSREQAVMALLGKSLARATSTESNLVILIEYFPGCGVQCVIARSFAFIFQRNMPNLGLMGITMQDEQFFEAATEGVDITIDFQKRALKAGGKEFQFQLSQMEKRLYDHGGISSAFRHFGKHLFEVMTTTKYTTKSYGALTETKPELQW